MFYKALGLAVWKGGSWYLRRRYGAAPERGRHGLGVRGVALSAVAGAAALLVRRRAHAAR